MPDHPASSPDSDAAAAIADLRGALGAAAVLTGADGAAFAADWTGNYRWTPLCVARPADRDQVSDVLRIAARHRVKVVPVSGNTGLSGGTMAPGAIMLSLERMNRIIEIRPEARVMVVEAGAIVADIEKAAEEHDLLFPLFFGARGTARIGGALSTNAGGSNVLRYGSTRALCLGLEVVLPSGEVLDLMTSLHKDNAGYDLRDLFIGAEGTLGIITGAVLKLFPRPHAHATALIAVPDLAEALQLLNHLQKETGGLVEAFEYMPAHYIAAWLDAHPERRPPFDAPHEVTLLIELAATAPRDCMPGPDGAVPLVAQLEDLLMALAEEGRVLDAVIARNDAQRQEMWAMREEAAALTVRGGRHAVFTDVALPLDRVHDFLGRVLGAVRELDPGVEEFFVAHLGDGNVHYDLWPSRHDPDLDEALRERVEALAVSLGGSFSAEHGVGFAKLGAMRRHKDPVALALMQKIRAVLDPDGLLNPGRTIPAATPG